MKRGNGVLGEVHIDDMLARCGCAAHIFICIIGPFSGVDNQVKVWDIRMMRPMHAYFSYSPANSLEISQRGMLAVGYGRKVQVGVRPHYIPGDPFPK